MDRTTSTARIDMQKLQILNDRIMHCLDALNQVRFSVQNVAPAYIPANGQSAFGQPTLGQPTLGHYASLPQTSYTTLPQYGIPQYGFSTQPQQFGIPAQPQQFGFAPSYGFSSPISAQPWSVAPTAWGQPVVSPVDELERTRRAHMNGNFQSTMGW